VRRPAACAPRALLAVARYPDLDLDRAGGVIRDVEHAVQPRRRPRGALPATSAPDGCIVKTAGVTRKCSGSLAAGHRLRRARNAAAIGILGAGAARARGDHPLRGPRGRNPACRNAKPPGLPERRRARHGLRARHRRALLGRDLGSLIGTSRPRPPPAVRSRSWSRATRIRWTSPAHDRSSSWTSAARAAARGDGGPVARRPGGRRSRGSGSSRRRSGPTRASQRRPPSGRCGTWKPPDGPAVDAPKRPVDTAPHDDLAATNRPRSPLVWRRS